jgi:hypothetical protein
MRLPPTHGVRQPYHPKEGIMTMSIEELYDRVLALSSNVEDTFLELGRSLRRLLDETRTCFSRS